MTEYVDARDYHPDYKRADCAECGGERRFTRSERDGVTVWLCKECGTREHLDIEVACPECDRRMAFEQNADRWLCRFCGAERESDKGRLIDRITERGDHRIGFLLGEPCPLCGADHGVHADPDATLLCRECEDIYWYSPRDEWWAYAEWLRHRGRSGRLEAPRWIRVPARADP